MRGKYCRIYRIGGTHCRTPQGEIMKCFLCGAVKDLVRLGCGDGMHALCVSCNNARYNSPIKDSSGHDIPGTHNTMCPLCGKESVHPVYRAMVSQQTKSF